jgi:PLP dependent protein
MGRKENLRQVRQRLEQACLRAGRSPKEVRLVGVSKLFPPAAVDEVLDAGLRDIGENRVQEARDKKPAVTRTALWHCIGPLQTNKAKYVPGLFDWLQTLCRTSVAAALEKRLAAEGRTLNVLLQVNVGGEEQKHGLDPAELVAFTERLPDYPHLLPHGLMTIPPYHPDPERERPYYRMLRQCRDELLERGFAWCRELSMGMSHDFEVAIEEGATMVRVGTAIFGERDRNG